MLNTKPNAGFIVALVTAILGVTHLGGCSPAAGDAPPVAPPADGLTVRGETIGQASARVTTPFVACSMLALAGGKHCDVTQLPGGSVSHSGTTTRYGVDCAGPAGTIDTAPLGGNVVQFKDVYSGGWGYSNRVQYNDAPDWRHTGHCADRFAVESVVWTGQALCDQGSTGKSYGPHDHLDCHASAQTGAASQPWRLCARHGSPDVAATCEDVSALELGETLYGAGFDGRGLVLSTLKTYLAHRGAIGAPVAAATTTEVRYDAGAASQDDADRWEYTLIHLSDGTVLVGAYDRFQLAPKKGERQRHLRAYWGQSDPARPAATISLRGVGDGPAFDASWGDFPRIWSVPAPVGVERVASSEDWDIGVRYAGNLALVVAQDRLSRDNIWLGVSRDVTNLSDIEWRQRPRDLQ